MIHVFAFIPDEEIYHIPRVIRRSSIQSSNQSIISPEQMRSVASRFGFPSYISTVSSIHIYLLIILWFMHITIEYSYTASANQGSMSMTGLTRDQGDIDPPPAMGGGDPTTCAESSTSCVVCTCHRICTFSHMTASICALFLQGVMHHFIFRLPVLWPTALWGPVG